MKQLRIVLLSTLNSEILGYILKGFLLNGIKVHSIVFDSADVNNKDKLLWEERTQGNLPLMPLYNFETELIPFFFVKNHSSSLMIDYIVKSKVDILVNAGTPRILKEDLICCAKLGVINCHPGLMPKYRGCTNTEWAIYNDDPVGNTVHFMTSSIDEGPIIAQEQVVLSKKDNYSDIRVKIFIHGFDLLARSIKIIMDNSVKTSQNYTKNGTYYKVIDKDKMEIVISKINEKKYKYLQ